MCRSPGAPRPAMGFGSVWVPVPSEQRHSLVPHAVEKSFRMQPALLSPSSGRAPWESGENQRPFHRAWSCSPRSSSSGCDWSHPHPQGAAEPVPEPSSAPAAGLGTGASPLLSPSLPAASLARGGRNNWCVGGGGAAARTLLCRAASLRLGTAASRWPGFLQQTGVMVVRTPPAHSRDTLVRGVSLSRKDAAGPGRGGGLGDRGTSAPHPCILPQPLSSAPCGSPQLLGGGVRVPEAPQQQGQDPRAHLAAETLTSCPYGHAAPSLPASVSLPGRRLRGKPGPGATSGRCRDLTGKLPGEKPLGWGLPPSPHAEIPSPSAAAGKWVKALARGGIFPSV